MKNGIIDVGGGLRGIYGAGVLDRCLEEASMAGTSPFMMNTASARNT